MAKKSASASTLTVDDLRSVLADNQLGSFRSFPYITIKQPSVKALRPFANAGLVTIVKMPASGYAGKRELRVFLTERAAREMYGEDSNQFRSAAWWPTIPGIEVVAQARSGNPSISAAAKRLANPRSY